MALRGILSKRFPSTAARGISRNSIEHADFPPARTADPAEFSSANTDMTGFFQRRSINNQHYFMNFPAGENLREKIKSLNSRESNRLHLEVLEQHTVPVPVPSPEAEVRLNLSVAEARKLLRYAQIEKARRRLRNIPANTITYRELVRICGDGNEEAGPDLAKALDESGHVIVLGGIVFLNPDQVAKSVEKLISETTSLPGDPRREELAQLEREKALIDEKAQSLVRRELYIGLGLFMGQTLGFMRLTFWELTWDVMEPICFFFTSFHFFLAYAFFMRTSTEPSFQGFFQQRLKLKQQKLMELHKFDLQRYDHLRKVFYPVDPSLENDLAQHY